MAQVVIFFHELKSFLRISIRTWLMDQNPCETSHFLAIGVLTQRWSTSTGDPSGEPAAQERRMVGHQRSGSQGLAGGIGGSVLPDEVGK